MPFNSPRHRAFKCLSHFNNSCFSACWKWKERVFFSSASIEVSGVLKLSGKVLCAKRLPLTPVVVRIRISSLCDQVTFAVAGEVS